MRTFWRLTHVARGVDPRVASNRFALASAAAFTVVSGVVLLAATERSFGAAALDGLRYGVAAFLAWAMARELDPDRNASARLAVAVMVVAAFAGVPSVLATLVLVVAARIAARTTGLPPTTIDYVWLALVAGLAATGSAGLVTGFVLAWAIHRDSRLPDPAPERPTEVAALVTAAVVLVVTIVSGSFASGWEAPGWLEVLLLLAAAASSYAIRGATEVRSTPDRRGSPIHGERVRHARLLAGVSVLAAFVWSGSSAVAALSPVLAALIGTGIVQEGLVERLRGGLARKG